MKTNMDNLKEKRDAETDRANQFEQSLREVSAALVEQQTKNTKLDEHSKLVEKDNRSLVLELKKHSTMIAEIKETKASFTSKVDQLEKEKVALVLEQINHVKEIESLTKQIENLESTRSIMKAKLDQEAQSKLQAINAKAFLEKEIRELEDDRRESTEVGTYKIVCFH